MVYVKITKSFFKQYTRFVKMIVLNGFKNINKFEGVLNFV